MSEEIVTWTVVRNGQVWGIYDEECAAKRYAQQSGGTVVRLTGKLPAKPIERRTTAWVEFQDPKEDSMFTFEKIGVVSIGEKFNGRQTKVEIIVREIPEEGEQ